MKRIDHKSLKYFPMLAKSSSWEDAWDVLLKQNYTLEIEDKLIGNNRPRKSVLVIHLCKDDVLINDFELTGDDRIIYFDGVDFDFYAIYQLAIGYLIKNKLIKKFKISNNKREDLKKARDRITMKIWAWKKQGKNVTELEKEKVNITNKMKNL